LPLSSIVGEIEVELEAVARVKAVSKHVDKTDLQISAFTINYPEEAVGIVRACKKFDIPVVISFTVETNGKLPNGQSIKVKFIWSVSRIWTN